MERLIFGYKASMEMLNLWTHAAGPGDMFSPTSTHILSFSFFVNLDVVDKMGHTWNNLAVSAYGNVFMSDLGNVTVE